MKSLTDTFEDWFRELVGCFEDWFRELVGCEVARQLARTNDPTSPNYTRQPPHIVMPTKTKGIAYGGIIERARKTVQEFIDTNPAAKRTEGFKRSDMAGIATKYGLKIDNQAFSAILSEMRKAGKLSMSDTRSRARYVVIDGAKNEDQSSSEHIQSNAFGVVEP